jgi:hypothetical protein
MLLLLLPPLPAARTPCPGAGVPPKLYANNWYVPTDTPLHYSGPYAMEVVDIKW